MQPLKLEIQRFKNKEMPPEIAMLTTATQVLGVEPDKPRRVRSEGCKRNGRHPRQGRTLGYRNLNCPGLQTSAMEVLDARL